MRSYTRRAQLPCLTQKRLLNLNDSIGDLVFASTIYHISSCKLENETLPALISRSTLCSIRGETITFGLVIKKAQTSAPAAQH